MKYKIFPTIIMVTKYSLYVFSVLIISMSSMLAESVSGQIKSIKEVEIEIDNSSERLDQVLENIEDKTDFRFFYTDKSIKKNTKIFLLNKRGTVADYLMEISSQAGVHFRQVNTTISISEKKDLTFSNDVEVVIDEQINVTGQITDENGEGLPGATVLEKGTSNGTVTDIDGMYNLSVGPDATLTVSFVGYETMEIPVNDRSVVDIELTADISALEEVVVVGYGTQKKVNLTGAVTSVQGDDLVKQSATAAIDALQGVMPGTVITRESGSPGDENYNIQIRGLSSVNGGSALILVDGVEGSLDDVRPEDIESISILKDASAAAIYGAKAAGGVVMVTTKRGETGQLKVEYNTFYSMAKMGRAPERLSSRKYAEMRNEAMINSGASAVLTDDQLDYLSDPNYLVDENPGNPNQWRYWGDYDYVDLTTKNLTVQQSHNVAISGGTENTTYRLSGTYFKNDGMLKIGPDLNERYTGRLNMDSRLGQYLKLSTGISYARNLIQKPAGGSQLEGTYGFLSNIYTYPGVTPLYDPNGNWAWGSRVGGFDGRSKLSYVSHDAGLNERDQNNLRLNSVLTIDNLVENLQFRLVGVMDANFNKELDRHNPIYEYGIDESVIGPIYENSQVSKGQTNDLFKEFQFLVDYNLSLGDHAIKLLGGYSAQDYRREWFSAQVTDLVNGNLYDFNWASNENITLGDQVVTNAFQSVFGRVNYTFKDRYLIEANVRYDGSSKLNPDDRYQLFPSASVGWRLSEESWFNVGPISELKFRASKGQLGNAAAVGNYSYIGLLRVRDDLLLGTNDQRTQYVDQQNLASKRVTWETVETSNIGIDLGLFDDKLTLTGDYFVKRNKDMLAAVEYPSVIGVGVPNQNVGELKTWGWGIDLMWRQDNGQGFNYWISGNIADAQNELVDYLGADVIREGTNRLLQGMPVNSIYGFRTDGFFQTQEEVDEHAQQHNNTGAGDVKYIDIDGDGEITLGEQTVENHGDLVYIGNTSPRYTYGIQGGFNFKGFDFNIFFQGVGKRIFVMDKFSMMPFFRPWLGPQAQHADYWTVDNPDAFWPRLYQRGEHNFRTSDKWVQNAAYIRLKNIQIGYTIPSVLLSSAGIERLRVYVAGRDLWEATKAFDYIDPETPDRATYQYPFRRRFTVGLNVTF